MEGMNDKIRRLRKEKGLSQSEVAKACGINQASYSNIEKGETKSISIEVGKGIAKALGVSFNELFEIDLPNVDSRIKNLEAERDELKKENERQQREIHNYEVLINLLRDRNMITSPRSDKQEREFAIAGDAYLTEWINSYDENLEKAITELKNNPALIKLLEDGIIKDGFLFDVWEDQFKNK